VNSRVARVFFVLACCAEVRAQPATTLSPQDYIDIRMLSARYSQIIEHCTNKGYDYAALYTSDGEFGRTDAIGVLPKEISKGPDALANAAGGGPGGCQPDWPGDGLTHLIINTVITPLPTGAHGMSMLIIIGLNHDPSNIRRIGSYEDTYVKTASGWRFKTRWHVFPVRAAPPGR
jgi:SnoaL-like domain